MASLFHAQETIEYSTMGKRNKNVLLDVCSADIYEAANILVVLVFYIIHFIS